MPNCSETNPCETETKTERCPVEKSVSEMCCPVESSSRLLTQAFFQAMKEVEVDLLKEKIKKAWGSNIEKQADAVITAMGAHWQALLAQAKAQGDLREAIKKIFEQSMPK